MNNNKNSVIDQRVKEEYKYGFITEIESDTIDPGISEETIHFISKKKKEPFWLLEWRLKAYRKWLKMKEPNWQNVNYDKIDYQDISYYSAPKKKELKSLENYFGLKKISLNLFMINFYRVTDQLGILLRVSTVFTREIWFWNLVVIH